MSDVIDIWLTDFQSRSPTLAGSLSAARDYPSVAAAALVEMVSSVAARRLVGEMAQ